MSSNNLEQEVLDIADYLGCNGSELWSELSKLIASHDREIEREAREREATLLNAIGLMYAQYCSKPLGHMFMGAGEAAIDVLEDYGVHHEDAAWTDETYDRLEDRINELKGEKTE